MLRDSDRLQSSTIFGEFGILSIMSFVTTFKEMNGLVVYFFSEHIFGQLALKEQIDNWRKAAAAVEISETLKLYILLWHIEVLDNFGGDEGLGLWTEQGGESIPLEFLKIFDHYKMNFIVEPKLP